MLKFDKFSAWISVDGIKLTEYSDEKSADGKQITCWVASEAGKNFSVCLSNSPCPFDAKGVVVVDGIECGTMHLPAKRKTKAERSYVRVSENTIRPLLFSPVQLTDDESCLNHSISPDLGDIKLEILEVEVQERKKAEHSKTNHNYCTEKFSQAEIIHEESKKVVGHHVGLGEEIIRPKVGSKVKFKTVRTICTFIFKYRPLELLQASGIALIDKKRKREALPTVNDASMKHVESEDSKRIRELEEELRLLKRKRTQSSKTHQYKLKEEASVNFLPGEIIDLT